MRCPINGTSNIRVTMLMFMEAHFQRGEMWGRHVKKQGILAATDSKELEKRAPDGVLYKYRVMNTMQSKLNAD